MWARRYAGSVAISKQAAKKEQLRLVTEAEATCKAAQAQLKWAPPGQTAAAGGAATEARAALAAELKVLSDNFAGLRKLVEIQEVSWLCTVYKIPGQTQKTSSINVHMAASMLLDFQKSVLCIHYR